MTREELRERIKNEVVLHEGELADWQWRQKGLVDEATELGILPSDFIRLVNEVSLQVNRDYSKISELKSRIETLARQRAKQLTPADIDQITAEAERVQLSRSFVEEQWIPAILDTLPDVKPEEPAAPTTLAGNRSGEASRPQPGEAEPPPSPVTKTDSVRRKIKSILDDYDKHIPAQSLKFLFKAVDYDESGLAEEIRQYLSENYYASVNPPKGNTLKEKLTSTDWRHLSWWEKGSPNAPGSAPMNPVMGGAAVAPSAVNQPVVRPQPAPPAPPTPVPTPSKSGMSDVALIALSILTALVLIWVVMRLARGEEDKPEKNPPARKEQTTEPAPKAKKGKRTGIATPKANKGSTSLAGRKGKTGNGSLFDEVDNRVGEFGLRAARKGSKWGYIDKHDKWVIKPAYDMATPFNDSRASVELNGNQFFIDRHGEPIWPEN